MEHTVRFSGNTVIIANDGHFDPEKVFFCGQAFRWRKTGDAYRGVAHGRVVYVHATPADIRLYPVTKEDYRAVWEHYFDLRRDYARLAQSFARDAVLQKGMEYARGVRVLNQQPFETLISFILSANNNIGRITGIVERLCRAFGRAIGEDGGPLHAFPQPGALAAAREQEIVACGAGYRAAYVREAAAAVSKGFGLEALARMPYAEAKRALMRLNGVGGKVADCVLLYSLGFSQAFPMDVWMKRTIYALYGYCGRPRDLQGFIGETFGEHAGIAQQYLFHYVRKNRLGRPGMAGPQTGY